MRKPRRLIQLWAYRFNSLKRGDKIKAALIIRFNRMDGQPSIFYKVDKSFLKKCVTENYSINMIEIIQIEVSLQFSLQTKGSLVWIKKR